MHGKREVPVAGAVAVVGVPTAFEGLLAHAGLELVGSVFDQVGEHSPVEDAVNARRVPKSAKTLVGGGAHRHGEQADRAGAVQVVGDALPRQGQMGAGHAHVAFVGVPHREHAEGPVRAFDLLGGLRERTGALAHRRRRLDAGIARIAQGLVDADGPCARRQRDCLGHPHRPYLVVRLARLIRSMSCGCSSKGTSKA